MQRRRTQPLRLPDPCLVLWGPGSPPFAGRTVSVEAATCYPRPLQERIPLLVGGQGERRTLRLAARHADGRYRLLVEAGVQEAIIRPLDLADGAKAVERLYPLLAPFAP